MLDIEDRSAKLSKTLQNFIVFKTNERINPIQLYSAILGKTIRLPIFHAAQSFRTFYIKVRAVLGLKI